MPDVMEFEALSFESNEIDYEFTLFQALVNEGKHIKILNSKRPQFTYNEKQLRDAAAAEVMTKLQTSSSDANIVEDDDGKGTNKKRKSLDPDEKQKQSRDRNREHAKNTRLRKKAYVLKLKELVDQMSYQKEAEERERKFLGEKINDTHILRKNAVRLFLLYRSKCITDREKWSNILDENITLTLPITPYRSFNRSEINQSNRISTGIDSVISDTCSLALMVECIGFNSDLWKEAIIRGESSLLSYSSIVSYPQSEFSTNNPSNPVNSATSNSNNHMLVSGDLVMCHYVMKAEDSDVVVGALSTCIQHGMLLCKFNKSNKIIAIEMVFDVMGFMQQIQRASGITPENSIVPNTLDMALQGCKESRAILRVSPDFAFLNVNDAWTTNLGHSQFDVEGKPFFEMMSIHSAFNEQISSLTNECAIGRAGSRVIIYKRMNATNDSDVNVGYIRMLPLTTDTETTPTHILVTITPLSIITSPEEIDSIISHHSQISGTIASSSYPQYLQQLEYLDAYEVEYLRQCKSFKIHYQNIVNTTHSTIPSNDLNTVISTNSNSTSQSIAVPNQLAMNSLQNNDMNMSNNLNNNMPNQINNNMNNADSGNYYFSTYHASPYPPEAQYMPYYNNNPVSNNISNPMMVLPMHMSQHPSNFYNQPSHFNDMDGSNRDDRNPMMYYSNQQSNQMLPMQLPNRSFNPEGMYSRPSYMVRNSNQPPITSNMSTISSLTDTSQYRHPQMNEDIYYNSKPLNTNPANISSLNKNKVMKRTLNDVNNVSVNSNSNDGSQV